MRKRFTSLPRCRKRGPSLPDALPQSLQSQIPGSSLHIRNVACAKLPCKRGCCIRTTAMDERMLALFGGCSGRGGRKWLGSRALPPRVIDSVDADLLVPLVGVLFEPHTDLLGYSPG